MKTGIAARDDSVWQGHPDVAYWQGRLFVVYRESNRHRATSNTSICIVYSSDGGNTFSRPFTVHESNRRWNCPRLFIVDDQLWIICDQVASVSDPKDFFDFENDPKKTNIFVCRVQFYNTNMIFENIVGTNMSGILPDRITKTPAGFITTTHTMGKHGHLVCHAWITKNFNNSNINDQQPQQPQDRHGASLSSCIANPLIGDWEKFTIMDDPHTTHCEGSIFKFQNELHCILRTHTDGYNPGFFCSSKDGKGWGKLKVSHLFGCHRPTAGVLDSGKILVTYRMSPCMDPYYWARTTMACLIEDPKHMEQHRMREIDFDRHEICDSGYTGWCQLPNGEICVVNYVKDDAPKPYIRWYRFREEEFFGK